LKCLGQSFDCGPKFLHGSRDSDHAPFICGLTSVVRTCNGQHTYRLWILFLHRLQRYERRRKM